MHLLFVGSLQIKYDLQIQPLTFCGIISTINRRRIQTVRSRPGKLRELLINIYGNYMIKISSVGKHMYDMLLILKPPASQPNPGCA